MKTRILHIDALRAIAVLLVVWQHSSEVFLGYLSDPQNHGAMLAHIPHLLDFGRIGVIIFFCISGYVIPSSLADDSNSSLRKFAISRFFRLFPAYWISIPLGYLTTYFLWNKSFSTFDWIANFTMIPEWIGAQPAMGLYWTLQIELVFYFLCAALFFFRFLNLPQFKGVLALLFSLVFLLSLAQRVPLFITLPRVFDGIQMWAAFLSMMFFGACLRDYHDNPNKRDLIMLLLFGLGWIIILPLSGLAIWIKDSSLHPDLVRFFSSYSLGAAIFVLLSTIITLTNKPLVYIGKISYSIYLMHPVVIYILAWSGLKTIGETGKINIHLAFSIIAATMLTILFSGFIFKYIEQPAINLGKRLANSLKT